MVWRSEESKAKRRKAKQERQNRLRAERTLAKICTCCGKAPAGETRRCERCRNLYKAYNKKKRDNLKALAFEAYGAPTCNCCKKSYSLCFLQIDHVNGDGYKHLRSNGRRRYKGEVMYQWLKKHNYPPGFQLLCANCNFAKGNKSICPCQIEAERTVITLHSKKLYKYEIEG